MGEMDIIINEKNVKITSLESEISRLKANIVKIKGFNADCVAKRDVAIDVVERLKRLRVISWIGILCPVPIAIVGNIDFLAGGVFGIACASACVIIYKKEILSEVDRISTKYNLKS